MKYLLMFKSLMTILILGISVPALASDILATTKLAQKGDPKAQDVLGVAYMNGDGVKKDAYEAFKWFQKSANQDYPYGQFHLGLLYARGEGTSQDDQKSMEWLKKGCDNRVEKSCEFYEIVKRTSGYSTGTVYAVNANNECVPIGMTMQEVVKESHKVIELPKITGAYFVFPDESMQMTTVYINEEICNKNKR